jgi:imidazolonepropionase-like amidohydrolase
LYVASPFAVPAQAGIQRLCEAGERHWMALHCVHRTTPAFAAMTMKGRITDWRGGCPPTHQCLVRTSSWSSQRTTELHAAGAGLLLGSDAPQIFNVPGFAIQHELRMLVDAGLTPYQALETGTRNVAVFFGAQNEFGTVEVGRAADLILLEANPLQDIRNVQRRAGVMVCGRWLPESEIQQRLETVAAGMRS